MIAIVVSDKRMDTLAKLLSQFESCLMIRKAIDLVDAVNKAGCLRAVVLPMGGVSENNEVKLQSQTIHLIQLFNCLNSDTLIFTGRMNDALNKLKFKVINLSKIDEVQHCHAKLSAHGILAELIHKTPEDFTEYTYDVLGYGCCGKEVVRCLKNNECQVRVISRRKEVVEGCINYINYALDKPSDIIIVCASECVLTENMIRNWVKKPQYILDLSSEGIGVENGVEQIVQVIKLGALPALAGPNTSAKLLSESIMKELKR